LGKRVGDISGQRIKITDEVSVLKKHLDKVMRNIQSKTTRWSNFENLDVAMQDF